MALDLEKFILHTTFFRPNPPPSGRQGSLQQTTFFRVPGALWGWERSSVCALEGRDLSFPVTGRILPWSGSVPPHTASWGSPAPQPSLADLKGWPQPPMGLWQQQMRGEETTNIEPLLLNKTQPAQLLSSPPTPLPESPTQSYDPCRPVADESGQEPWLI